MANCVAYNCQCVASMSKLCRWHYGAEPRDWPSITEKLNQNQRLLIAMDWVISGGGGRSDRNIIQGLMRLSTDYPQLIPEPEESPQLWLYRAIGWMSREIQPDRGEVQRRFQKAKLMRVI